MYRTPAIAGRIVFALIICTVLCLGGNEVAAQSSDTLRMQIGNGSGYIGKLVPIPIYLSTEMDDTLFCGGFDIFISLSRPDLMFFEVDTTTVDTIIEGDPPETTYVDIDTMFVCEFDTTDGSLASGWDVVNARSTIGKGLELQLMGMSDFMEEGDLAIPANTSGVLLTIFGRIFSDVPDTLQDRLVNIDPYSCYYSNSRGGLILPEESTSGTVEVEATAKGDVNCDGSINPLDVAYIVNRVYKGWMVLCNDELGDIDCSGGLNPLDAVYVMNYVYKQWPFRDC